ncbi:MAG: A/G-specific adenine glycosylase [Candidatus Acidiferrales bacterium]
MAPSLTLASPAQLQHRILPWFRKHRRDLPWRASRDPYRVWIAEVMLQQTRIAAVLPYYQRFLARFPSMQSLAAARQHDVLKFWSGLGYYSRARHLHRAAREIVARHGGEFPRDRASALALPGIGRYTAAAVLSIAYDAPYAVLDGNVARVLARLGAMRGDLREPRRWKALGDAAQRLLSAAAPGDWNQALMELGETICTPQSPSCPDCPAAALCRARRLGLTSQIPTPRKKPASVAVRIAAAVLLDSSGRTLLSKDPGSHDTVLFSRMWQFPAVEVVRHARAELAVHLRATLGLQPAAIEELPAARHSVTFRSITLLPFLVRVPRLPHRARTRIVPLAEFAHLSRVPISSATRKIAAAAAASAATSIITPIPTPAARPRKPRHRSRR